MTDSQTRPTSIRVDKSIYDAFVEYAKSEGRSVSKQIAREMRRAVDEWKKSAIADFPNTAASAGTGKRPRVRRKANGR